MRLQKLVSFVLLRYPGLISLAFVAGILIEGDLARFIAKIAVVTTDTITTKATSIVLVAFINPLPTIQRIVNDFLAK
jgi:hypothetical protein